MKGGEFSNQSAIADANSAFLKQVTDERAQVEAQRLQPRGESPDEGGAQDGQGGNKRGKKRQGPANRGFGPGGPANNNGLDGGVYNNQGNGGPQRADIVQPDDPTGPLPDYQAPAQGDQTQAYAHSPYDRPPEPARVGDLVGNVVAGGKWLVDRVPRPAQVQGPSIGAPEEAVNLRDLLHNLRNQQRGTPARAPQVPPRAQATPPQYSGSSDGDQYGQWGWDTSSNPGGGYSQGLDWVTPTPGSNPNTPNTSFTGSYISSAPVDAFQTYASQDRVPVTQHTPIPSEPLATGMPIGNGFADTNPGDSQTGPLNGSGDRGVSNGSSEAFSEAAETQIRPRIPSEESVQQLSGELDILRDYFRDNTVQEIAYEDEVRIQQAYQDWQRMLRDIDAHPGPEANGATNALHLTAQDMLEFHGNLRSAEDLLVGHVVERINDELQGPQMTYADMQRELQQLPQHIQLAEGQAVEDTPQAQHLLQMINATQEAFIGEILRDIPLGTRTTRVLPSQRRAIITAAQEGDTDGLQGVIDDIGAQIRDGIMPYNGDRENPQLPTPDEIIEAFEDTDFMTERYQVQEAKEGWEFVPEGEQREGLDDTRAERIRNAIFDSLNNQVPPVGVTRESLEKQARRIPESIRPLIINPYIEATRIELDEVQRIFRERWDTERFRTAIESVYEVRIEGDHAQRAVDALRHFISYAESWEGIAVNQAYIQRFGRLLQEYRNATEEVPVELVMLQTFAINPNHVNEYIRTNYQVDLQNISFKEDIFALLTTVVEEEIAPAESPLETLRAVDIELREIATRQATTSPKIPS